MYSDDDHVIAPPLTKQPIRVQDAYANASVNEILSNWQAVKRPGFSKDGSFDANYFAALVHANNERVIRDYNHDCILQRQLTSAMQGKEYEEEG